jgi:hypothetical protein
MIPANADSIRERLVGVLSEMREQSQLADYFGGELLPFAEYME